MTYLLVSTAAQAERYLTYAGSSIRREGEPCELVDEAVAAGWAHTRDRARLEVADVPEHRWRVRPRDAGTLFCRAPGDNPVPGCWPAEDAVFELIDQWGPIDRDTASWPLAVATPARCWSRRRLRVAANHQVSLPGEREQGSTGAGRMTVRRSSSSGSATP